MQGARPPAPGSTFEVWPWGGGRPWLPNLPAPAQGEARERGVGLRNPSPLPLPPPPGTELLFLRRLQDVRAEEGQDVCLQVETGRVGAAGAVRWVRGGEPLPRDSRMSVAQDGHVCSLFIHGVVLADQGTYGCESRHDRTLARLSVRRECPVLS